MTQVLDHGYVEHVETWGSDQSVIEAARMSTDKGFLGWEPEYVCEQCSTRYTQGGALLADLVCCGMALTEEHPGDAKLLKYLYQHKHMTPFEMAGMTLEVKAPLFVFREWHRHRTMSYNEMSARYVPLPNENYMPGLENLTDRAIAAQESSNRQARGAADAKGNPIDQTTLDEWLRELAHAYRVAQSVYEHGLAMGVPKELARLCVPVARYSRMRVSANLRNWMQFLTLRTPNNAQEEIRHYAFACAQQLREAFPRTMALFDTSSI